MDFKNQKSVKVSFNVKIKDIMNQKLKYIAAYEGLSAADLARTIFHSYIKDFEKRNDRIDEAALKQVSIFDKK